WGGGPQGRRGSRLRGLRAQRAARGYTRGAPRLADDGRRLLPIYGEVARRAGGARGLEVFERGGQLAGTAEERLGLLLTGGGASPSVGTRPAGPEGVGA